MASSIEITPEDVTCHFCKKSRIQVGELSCGHRMCAMCFPYYSQKLDTCYLCVLATAEVKQTSMKFIHCFANVGQITDANEEQKIFCTNYGCNYIGSLLNMASHRDQCILPKPVEVKNQQSSDGGSGVVYKVSLDGDSLKISVPTGDKVFKLSDLCGFSPDSVTSGISAGTPENVPAKFSVEISEHIEADHDAEKSESFDSNLSTSVIVGNNSFAANDNVDWDLCVDESFIDTTTSSASKSSEDEASEVDSEDDGAGKNLDDEDEGEDAKLRHRISARHPLSHQAVPLQNPRRIARMPAKDLRDVGLLLLVSVVGLALAYSWQPTGEKPKHVKSFVNSGNNYVTWKVGNIADLVARAQFNSKDVKLSEFITVGGYKVRLGIGATHAFSEKAVVLWATAVVFRSDDEAWSRDERMQVRLENKDLELTHTYDFTAQQRGSWSENTRIQKRKLLVRQMQVETSSRFKYLRFSHFLTYEQAEAEGFLENDQLTVGFKLLR